MWYDRDIDALMQRTRRRPIPAGRIAPIKALAFGIALSLLAVIALGAAATLVAAGMLALAIGFYVFVYTMCLQRRPTENIVIGVSAGAFTPPTACVHVNRQRGARTNPPV